MSDQIVLVPAKDCQLGDAIYLYVNGIGSVCTQDNAIHTVEACIFVIDPQDPLHVTRAAGWKQAPIHLAAQMISCLQQYPPSRLHKVADFSSYQWYRWLEDSYLVGKKQQTTPGVSASGAINDHVCPTCSRKVSRKEAACWWCGSSL